jgi:hypothetical protein
MRFTFLVPHGTPLGFFLSASPAQTRNDSSLSLPVCQVM